MEKSVGQQLHEVVAEVDAYSPATQLEGSQYVSRTAGRLLEEVVELCLASGMSASDVLVRASDALHNEAKKGGVYPSELRRVGYSVGEMIVELGDVELLLDGLRHVAGINRPDVDKQKSGKLWTLLQLLKAGELKTVDGCLYKTSAR